MIYFIKQFLIESTQISVYVNMWHKCTSSDGFSHTNCYNKSLSSTGSILSNTDLSDLSTVGTCDIFVHQMRHSPVICPIKYCLSSASSRVTETVSMKMPCGECFQKCLSAYNMISLWLNTVIPIIVMIWLPKMTRYLHWRIIYRHLRLVTY